MNRYPGYRELGEQERMKQHFKKHAIGLLAALLVLMVLTVALILSGNGTPLMVKLMLAALSVVAGSVVTYKFPVSGAVAPTIAQAHLHSMVTAQVVFGTADTTATITHNMGLSATELAELMPIPIIYYNTAGTVDGFIQVSFPDGNTCVLTKTATGNGTESTLNVVLLRPQTTDR